MAAEADSLVDQVFKRLAHEILRGQTRPGENLPAERALAEQLKVNRQVVREAIRKLAHLGLVQVLHGDGTRVLDFREHGRLDLLELLMEHPPGRKSSLALWEPLVELREALAREVVRLCALRAKLSLRRELVRTCQAMSRAGDLGELRALEVRFWDLVHEGANHLVYRLTYNTIKRTIEAADERSIAWLADEVRRTQFRLPIAEAILAGDAERAERELQRATRARIDTLGKKKKGKAAANPLARKKASTV